MANLTGQTYMSILDTIVSPMDHNGDGTVTITVATDTPGQQHKIECLLTEEQLTKLRDDINGRLKQKTTGPQT